MLTVRKCLRPFLRSAKEKGDPISSRESQKLSVTQCYPPTIERFYNELANLPFDPEQFRTFSALAISTPSVIVSFMLDEECE